MRRSLSIAVLCGSLFLGTSTASGQYAEESILLIPKAVCSSFEGERVPTRIEVCVNDKGLTIIDFGKGSILFEERLEFTKVERLALITDLKKVLEWVNISEQTKVTSMVAKSLKKITCPSTGSAAMLAWGVMPDEHINKGMVIIAAGNSAGSYHEYTMKVDEALNTIPQFITALESVPEKYQDFLSRKKESDSLYR